MVNQKYNRKICTNNRTRSFSIIPFRQTNWIYTCHITDTSPQTLLPAIFNLSVQKAINGEHNFGTYIYRLCKTLEHFIPWLHKDCLWFYFKSILFTTNNLSAYLVVQSWNFTAFQFQEWNSFHKTNTISLEQTMLPNSWLHIM